jgi:hypothetical protein
MQKASERAVDGATSASHLLHREERYSDALGAARRASDGKARNNERHAMRCATKAPQWGTRND